MKKKWIAVLLAATMVFGATACSSGNEEKKDSKKEADSGEIEPCTINFKYWADNTEYSQLMQEIIEKFNKENEKGIEVVGEEVPWDGGAYSENLFNACMGGGSPDVATWKLTSTPLFVNNDLLTDLTPYIDKWEDKDDIPENIYNIMKEAGGSEEEMYVMPWNVQVLYVYYRPSIFEKAGVEVPKTYDEFLEAIKKCTMDTDGDGETDVYGFGMRGAKGGQEPWGSFIYGEGGDFENLTSKESVKGMQDFIDLYENGYVPPTAVSDGFQETVANFQSGLTAMFIHHTGSSANMEEVLGDDVAAFPFPAGEGQWTSMGDTETVIFESCENKAAAFEWVSYLATGEGQKMWCEGTGQVPVSQTVQQGEYFQNNKFMKASIEGMDYAGIIPIKDTTTEWISTVWPSTVGQALTGEISAKECMEILQEELYE
ncbi:sugar ABC transporter substrate-binding protein [Coprococcus sp. AF18-48]|nr:sugar ABC transporter substrate-binding protein [Coprococcus sp. AF18-48]